MMKLVLTVALIASLVFARQQEITSFPTGVVDTDNYYVVFQNNAYKYSLPNLNLVKSATYDVNLNQPGTLDSGLLTFATSNENSASTTIKASDLTVSSKQNTPAPAGDTPYYVFYANDCVTSGGDQYCWANNQITRKNGDNTVSVITIEGNGTKVGYFRADSSISGRLSLATQSCQYRGCSNLVYYRLDANPLAEVGTGVELPNTGSSGCPVQPDQCAVPVILDFHILNDVATWTWSISNNGVYEVHVESYDASTGQFSHALLPANAPTLAPAPSTAQPTIHQGSTSAPASFSFNLFFSFLVLSLVFIQENPILVVLTDLIFLRFDRFAITLRTIRTVRFKIHNV
jgi:hypothetical protein